MLGWVGFPNLPEQYCSDKVLLLKCCEKLGKTLILTGGEASGGKLVRMCEEIDLDKPLVSSIPIGEHMPTVEYEGLHSICFRCGAYGHCQCQCQETCLNNLQPRSGSRGRGRRRGHGCSGGSSSEIDKIDALGRLLTRILRHMAPELNLKMRSDGFVKVEDLLKLNLKTFANIWLTSHSVDDIRETVRRDNKQRLSLMEENGELWIRANQGHTIMTVETDSLLKPILSAEEVPVCVHGTYKRNLESILEQGLKRMKRLHIHFSCGLPTDGEVISGIRRDVNILIFLDVRKALEEGMKLYISDNKVILTEGFEGVVPVKYIQKIESWPDRNPISF